MIGIGQQCFGHFRHMFMQFFMCATGHGFDFFTSTFGGYQYEIHMKQKSKQKVCQIHQIEKNDSVTNGGRRGFGISFVHGTICLLGRGGGEKTRTQENNTIREKRICSSKTTGQLKNNRATQKQQGNSKTTRQHKNNRATPFYLQDKSLCLRSKR